MSPAGSNRVAHPRSGCFLVAVAVAYVLVQLLAAAHVNVGWDEAVYLSQVSRHVPAAAFSAPRARGISWLVAPVALLSSNRWLIRGYLAAASGIGLWAAFRPWLRIRAGMGVPLAAAILAALWPALFYGSEVMPNLWVAFAAVAVVGWFLRSVAAPTAVHLAALGGAVASAALMRPPDSTWLALALLAEAVVVPAWRRIPVLVTVVLAEVLGWLPWAVEAQLSYGGPLARLRAGSAIQGGTSPQFGVVTALRSVEGPVLCRPCHHAVPITGALFWAFGVVAVTVAVLTARRERRLAETVLPVVVGLTMAVQYLFLLGYSAPRFLLPSYALLSLPVAEALLLLPNRARTPAAHRRAVAAVAGVMVLLLAYQSAVLTVAIGNVDPQRNSWAALAAALRARQVTPRCLVVGAEAPPIAYYSGCASHLVQGSATSSTAAGLRELARRLPVAVVQTGRQRPPRFARGWRTLRLRTAYATWKVRLSVPRR